jgi:large subunit ribosomal protein L22
VPGPKTNEREGTRAVLRHSHVAPNKVREVLDLMRGKHVQEAAEILRFSERDAATIVGKVLASAVANAQANDGQDPEELFVSACFADEGTTMKRWRPRARGRATRIRKRTSHITVIVSRLPQDQLARLQSRRQAEQSARRARRVAGARKSAAGGPATTPPTGRGRLGRRRGGAAVATAEDESAIVEQSAEDAAAGELEAGEVLAAGELAAAEELAAGEVAAAEELAAGEELAAQELAKAEAAAAEELAKADEAAAEAEDKQANETEREADTTDAKGTDAEKGDK